MKKGTIKLQGKVIFPLCLIANDFISRFLGLMGRKTLSPSFALFFPKCNSIHTFFMRMPIDVIFLNENFEITALYKSLGPWKLILPKRNFKHVIEFKTGTIESFGLSLSQKVEIVEVAS